MSDNQYENLHFPDDNEKTELLHETPRHASESDHAAVPDPVHRPEPIQQPVNPQEQRPYSNPYVDRVNYQQPVQSRQEAYQNPYRAVGTPSYSRPEPTPAPTPSQPDQNPNDGFYHYNTRATENSRNIYSGASETPEKPVNNWSTTNSADGGNKKDKSPAAVCRRAVSRCCSLSVSSFPD